MDSGVEIAAIIAASVVIPVTAGIVVAGLYFITAYKQEQLNLRENLRVQKALAVAGANSGGGEMDLMTLAAQFLPALLNKAQGATPNPGVNGNGEEIQQGQGVGGPQVR
jgi:Na+-transporting NADH:ubiquinone oxidoreductase subunit NqrC